jgi:hypothetical protein
MLVPQMDGDFRIVDFLEFYNEQGFQLTYDLPQHYLGREVAIGDPAPLPFWHNGVCNIIEGDAEKSLVAQLFGSHQAQVDPVLRDLGRMLDDARSGRIKERIGGWEAADLASGFDDVFLGPPSRTRYWITRYRVALQEARKLASPPHPIDVRLRNAANRWLQKFGAKSDPHMLGSILGSSAQGIFSNDQIKNILFAYIVHKVATENTQDLEIILRENTAQTIFPGGIYDYYLQKGWPKAPFAYQQIDLIEMTRLVLGQAVERRSFGAAIRLSRLLFGDKDAPNKVDDYVMLHIRRSVEEYRRIKERFDDEWSQYPRSTDLTTWSWRILQCYRPIEQLSQITHGRDRIAGRMLEGRFGISASEIQDFRRWAGVQSEDL